MRQATFFLCIVILTTPSWSRTVVFEDSAARAIISDIVDKTFSLQYEAALKRVGDLEKLVPDHPIIPVLRGGVLYCRMLDYEDLLDLEEFERQYEIAWEKSEKLIESGESAEGELYLGVLLGFRALLHQRLGKWWPAVRYGLQAVGHLKSCLKSDSSYADAYLGIGCFKYWRSRATDFINWLPFIPDEKEAGITLIRHAAREGLFGREISRSTLAWILIDAGQPLEAIKLSIAGLNKYPGSRFYLWTLADGYYRIGKWRYAARVFQQLYDSIHASERNNHYNEVGICKKMVYIQQKLRQPRTALQWAELGLSFPLDKETRNRRKKDIEKLQRLQEQLQAQLQKVVSDR